MRLLRVTVVFLYVGLFLSLPAISGAALYSKCDKARRAALISRAVAYHAASAASGPIKNSLPAAEESGIKEDIPAKYQARYQSWKREFLATETGRQQWALYDSKQHFTLTITISDDNPNGGSTSNYKWDDAGQLVAATITLDRRLNSGFPNPIYYPVMNSLSLFDSSYQLDNEVLAAAKIAHEFGHLNYTARADATLYQLQTRLTPVYNKVFLSNGRNVNDVRLLGMAQQMGGTPIEIWENREYWGEVNAMEYLRDRFTERGPRCMLFNKIKQSINLYANNYADRFLQIARQAPNSCEWH